jgi:release factor glutamine methyltransferase
MLVPTLATGHCPPATEVATEISQLLDEGIARLRRVTDQPRHEAEILLAAALDKPRSWLIAHPEQRILDCDATDRYESHVTRRAHGEPVAYILGEKEFWSLPLAVTPDVLVPRPETELAVERALAHLPADAPGRVLDLAAGSGAIALAIAHDRPRLQVVGTDLSGAAVEVARRNASRLHLANVEFRSGDWYAPIGDERFTLVVSNPPYIAEGDTRVERAVRRYEPHDALFAGVDGLEALRVVVGGGPGHLVPGGWLVVEHGDTQGADVRALFELAGLAGVATHRDLAGLERCTEGRWPG